MKQKNRKRRGLTLVELLVVITIMMILAALVLPQLKFNTASHKNREAARMVASYLNIARNKAIETGKPCGVLFKRIDELTKANDLQDTGSTDPDTAIVSLQMLQIKTPPVYAGETMDARIYMVGGNRGCLYLTNVQADFIRVGDLIQIDGKGPWCRIGGNDLINNETGTIEPDGLIDQTTDLDGTTVPPMLIVTFSRQSGYSGKMPPIPSSASITTPIPYSFQIQRQPVSVGTWDNVNSSQRLTRSMAPPQNLPRGTAIDLTCSGVGGYYFSGSNFPVAIMFDGNGALKRVYGFGTNLIDAHPINLNFPTVPRNVDPIGPVYLLVGQELQAPGAHDVPWYVDPNGDDIEHLPNWQDPNSRWVVISPMTGVPTVAENVPVGEASTWASSASPGRSEVRSEGLTAARKIATEGIDRGDRR